MHDEARQFIIQVLETFPEYAQPEQVIVEFGSRVINTSVRDLFPTPHYTGVDQAPGRGVDKVSLIHEYHPWQPPTLIICTEVAEHDRYHDRSLAHMVSILPEGGSLLFTCASPQRPAHELDCAPPGDGIYYRGRSMIEVLQALRELAEWEFLWGEDNPNPGDTYILARRKLARTRRQTTSIVLPCVGAREMTEEALNSLVFLSNTSTEVILVDNGSSPAESAELRALYTQVYLRFPHLLGYPAAVNMGIRASAGQYVVLCNNDVVVKTQGWDALLIETLAGRHLAMVSPVFDYVGNPQQLFTEADDRDVRTVDVLFFVMVACNRRLFSQVGLLDERFGLGNSEDSDLSIRIRQAGGVLQVDPRVVVHHEGHHTFLKVIGRDRLQSLVRANRDTLIRKWYGQQEPSEDPLAQPSLEG